MSGRFLLASDHAGVEMKNQIVDHLRKLGFRAEDLGPSTHDSVDYPDYADLLAKKWTPGDWGVLICGSGQGICMRANRHPHLRAALCWNEDITRLSREHNDANVLCLGARSTNIETALQILKVFIETPFAGGRHQTRVDKLSLPVR